MNNGNDNNITRMDFKTGLEMPPIKEVAEAYFGMIATSLFGSYGEDCMGYKIKEVLDYIQSSIRAGK